MELSRRDFITKIMPACAATCLGCSTAFALTLSNKKSTLFQEKHKFDKEMERKLTLKQYFAARYREAIQQAKAFGDEIGYDKMIEILKKNTTKKMLEYGKTHAKRSPDNSFKTYVSTFRPPKYQDVLTHEVVEDTDTAFQLKVTECVWATTFLDANAGDIGYASVCYGDYSWTKGFNPKLKMVRDKTLMQGHDQCNHRYLNEA